MAADGQTDAKPVPSVSNVCQAQIAGFFGKKQTVNFAHFAARHKD